MICLDHLTWKVIEGSNQMDYLVVRSKILIIDKSLYGLKTSAARFHENLSQSFLSLGFKKFKHDTRLWMVDKSSHYEYLATYVDDIFLFDQGSYGSHKVIEKDIHAKECSHSRILFRWECGIPWRITEKSWIRISSFYKDLHSKRHSEI
jgi:hypothetical protein